MIDFCERLKEAMSIRGITQSELCELTGIPKSAMSQYISGAFKPKQQRTFFIAKALNVSETWLLGYDVPMEKLPSIDFDVPDENDKKLPKISISEFKKRIITLLKSLDENLLDLHAENYETLLYYYGTLNHVRKKELLKRAIELNQIEKYTKQEE